MSASIVADMKALRRALEAKRAEVATNGASFQNDQRSGNWHATDGSNFGADFKVIQEQIEAVDRVIAELTHDEADA